jgi:hypothetical protein
VKVTGTTDHPYLKANIWNLKMYTAAVFEKSNNPCLKNISRKSKHLE